MIPKNDLDITLFKKEHLSCDTGTRVHAGAGKERELNVSVRLTPHMIELKIRYVVKNTYKKAMAGPLYWPFVGSLNPWSNLNNGPIK